MPPRSWTPEIKKVDVQAARAVRDALRATGHNQTWLGSVLDLAQSTTSALLAAKDATRGLSVGELAAIEKALRDSPAPMPKGTLFIAANVVPPPSSLPTLADVVRSWPGLTPADRENLVVMANMAEARWAKVVAD